LLEAGSFRFAAPNSEPTIGRPTGRVTAWPYLLVTADEEASDLTRTLASALARSAAIGASNESKTVIHEGFPTMLVLTRRQNEEIVIGDDVVIRVLRTGSGSVKIGVTAPHGVGIRRGELSPREAAPGERSNEAFAVVSGLRLVAELGDETIGDSGKQAI
jgi:carbon storage regulator